MIGFVLSNAGVFCLCLGKRKHYQQLFASVPTRAAQFALWAGGYTLLAGAVYSCTQEFGLALGLVYFVAFVNVAAFCLALILAWYSAHQPEQTP